MIITAIRKSKMYQSSKRKSKIDAAINNPINQPLIMQLEEYLDEDDLDEIYDYDELNEVEDSAVQDKEIREENVIDDESNVEDSTYEPSSRKSSLPSPSPSREKFDNDIDFDESVTDTEESPKEIKKDQEVESSKIVGQTVLYPNIKCHTVLDSISNEEIKGLLNAIAETAGVERISNQNSELWIYYNDSINLNNVMNEVIHILDASSHNLLSFNRLARTDNAIVFDIIGA